MLIINTIDAASCHVLLFWRASYDGINSGVKVSKSNISNVVLVTYLRLVVFIHRVGPECLKCVS